MEAESWRKRHVKHSVYACSCLERNCSTAFYLPFFLLYPQKGPTHICMHPWHTWKTVASFYKYTREKNARTSFFGRSEE